MTCKRWRREGVVEEEAEAREIFIKDLKEIFIKGLREISSKVLDFLIVGGFYSEVVLQKRLREISSKICKDL